MKKLLINWSFVLEAESAPQAGIDCKAEPEHLAHASARSCCDAWLFVVTPNLIRCVVLMLLGRNFASSCAD
jgi:hypothetical protein